MDSEQEQKGDREGGRLKESLIIDAHCDLVKASSTARISSRSPQQVEAWVNDHMKNRPKFVRTVKPGGQQHRSTTRDCTLTIPFHSVHLRLPEYIRKLSCAEIHR